MRYNPSTDNAVANEKAQASMAWTMNRQIDEVTMLEAPPETIELPPTAADEAVGSATVSLWSACYALRRLKETDMNRCDLVALRRDVADVVRELDRLSI